MSWSIPRAWEGATSVILGGGLSLGEIDLWNIHRLQMYVPLRVMSINDAYKDERRKKVYPWDLAYFKDKNWYYQQAFKDFPGFEHNGHLLKSFQGLIVTSCEGLDEPGIHIMRRGRRDYLERDPAFITHANNAGAEALALTIMLGATTILLLGFDMKAPDGKHNYHNNHLREISPSIYETYYMTPFKCLAKDAKSLGVTILNCTADSALTTFPLVSLEEALDADSRMRA